MFETRIDVYHLVKSISIALGLVDKNLALHHMRVGYIAHCLSKVGYLNRRQESNILIAAMLHDLGAIQKEDAVEFLKFDPPDPHRHAEVGYQLLKDFDLFEDLAHIVRFHHVKYSERKSAQFRKNPFSLEADILHLADRIDVLTMQDGEYRLSDPEAILAEVEAHTPEMFNPKVVGWFRRLVNKEEFWLDLNSASLASILQDKFKRFEVDLGYDLLASYSHLLSQLVDFQSRFTSTHSSGVSASAEYLARVIGFSEKECQRLMVAGFLHDVGKLAIPSSILEKRAPLTEQEFKIVKSHAYHTAKILGPIPGIDEIIQWCSYHHEKLNGRGYPFGEVGANIPLAASILSVADIFTALTEDRPYRDGLPRETVLSIIKQAVERGELDKRVVTALETHYDDINDYRSLAQRYANDQYQTFLKSVRIYIRRGHPDLVDEQTPLVLLVDDDEMFLQIMETHLRELKVATLCATDGKSAYNLAIRQAPDLIICDISMPGMDGFDLLEKVQAHHHTQSIPVVMITIDETIETRHKAFRCGASDFITKPLNKTDFLPRIGRFLDL